MPEQGMNCGTCGQMLDNGVCLNIDCSAAQEQATRGAARQTAKATAGAVTPNAWSSSGRVD